MNVDDKVTKTKKHAYLDLKKGSKPVLYAISYKHHVTGEEIFLKLREGDLK